MIGTVSGKLIFVSGLTGAGKTTLVCGALDVIENLEPLLTYTTRPPRADEQPSREYMFVSDTEYEAIHAQSQKWDETIYDGHKYASDAEKFIADLAAGKNVIVSVTPSLDDIRAMTRIYGVEPVKIWIDTPKDVASARVQGDSERAARVDNDSARDYFDIIFEPVGDLDENIDSFIKLIHTII